MKLISYRNVVSLLAFIVLTAVTGYASPITVTNSSFEDPLGTLDRGLCGPGCSYNYIVPAGWTGSGLVGGFQPGSSSENFAYFNYVPDGVTVAFAAGGSISQVVSATVEEGVTYTLQVEWGRRTDNYFDSSAGIGLVIGDSTVLATGITPTSGNWSTYTATYIGTASDSGKSIAINLNAGVDQGDWDNVRLDASNESDSVRSPDIAAVPEPASYLLLSVSLFGLVVLYRSSRRVTFFHFWRTQRPVH